VGTGKEWEKHFAIYENKSFSTSLPDTKTKSKDIRKPKLFPLLGYFLAVKMCYFMVILF
jgi:hypothetical protein